MNLKYIVIFFRIIMKVKITYNKLYSSRVRIVRNKNHHNSYHLLRVSRLAMRAVHLQPSDAFQYVC